MMNTSKAVEGYLLDRQASGYSIGTIRLYRSNLGLLCRFLGDPPVEEIRLEDLQRFMVYLQTTYPPKRPGDVEGKLSLSAVDNYWKAIRSFFGWCKAALEIKRPDLRLARPPKADPEILPFSENDIRKLLKACERTTEVSSDGRKPYSMKRPTANRDKALLLLFLDTGLRVGEVTRLRIEDLNQETGEILVAPFGSGQKTKSRTAYLGRVAQRAMWLYLAKRLNTVPKDKLFELDAESIRSLFKRLGERAGVNNVHPHRLRHTFAINYLRNGGDIYTLKYLLGHSTLVMVERYLHLTTADASNAHRKASPADNWRL
jgi:integrase/recombinase XerD